jgi:transposase
MVDEEMGMPAKRELSMRQLRHLLRLHHGGVSAREIGRRLGVARSTIQDNLKRAAAVGLAWPLADDATDEVLELRLFGRAGFETGQRRRIEPDWAVLARELKRPGVTMMILWEEYRAINQDGYGYSRFCDLLRGFERRLTPVMRQHHVAGEKAFVDYSGKRIGIANPATGEIHEAEIFVGVLGASNLTYAEATWTQQLPDWTGAHVRMFRFFGGVPKLLVPDNLKSGVNKASFYDPEINRTYGAMAAHYGVGVLPARPGKPRDKAKVEAGVRFAQTYILGRLRHLTFFSLAECNEAITLVMQRMNERPMRHLGLSRRELFEKIERNVLGALPSEDWEFAEWRRARVNLDYHIEAHDFLYSVPHALLRAEVEVRVTARIIEVFHRGQRVAVHQRRYMGRKHGTDPDHMPSSHRRYAEWTPDRFRRWASKIGPNTEGLISAVLASRAHPEQGFRTCLGILRSYRGLDVIRLEAVSARAVELGVLNCKGVAALLAHKTDDAASKDNRPATLFDHANLRGPGYYH